MLVTAIPLTERIKNQLDSGRDSQLFENSVEVVAYRMVLHFDVLGNFAVLCVVSDGVHRVSLMTVVCRAWVVTEGTALCSRQISERGG